jgi:signal transduction histidine kinase
LSIVQKIANIYGGSVEVESEPDVGSTFRVMLDAEAAAGSGEDAKAAGPGRDAGGR